MTLVLQQVDVVYSSALDARVKLQQAFAALFFLVTDKWLPRLRELACLLLTVASFLSFPYRTPSGPVLSLEKGVHFLKETSPSLWKQSSSYTCAMLE